MRYLPLTDSDRQLIDAAAEVIRRNYFPDRHHVGAAVRCGSGKIYTGVHLESCAIDVCAEPVAMGAAASAGEREFEVIVAVKMTADGEPRVLSPCGVCRELIRHYSPDILVIFEEDGQVRKCRVLDLLPGPYKSS